MILPLPSEFIASLLVLLIGAPINFGATVLGESTLVPVYPNGQGVHDLIEELSDDVDFAAEWRLKVVL